MFSTPDYKPAIAAPPRSAATPPQPAEGPASRQVSLAVNAPGSLRPAHFLALQRSIGNRAVLQLLRVRHGATASPVMATVQRSGASSAMDLDEHGADEDAGNVRGFFDESGRWTDLAPGEAPLGTTVYDAREMLEDEEERDQLGLLAEHLERAQRHDLADRVREIASELDGEDLAETGMVGMLEEDDGSDEEEDNLRLYAEGRRWRELGPEEDAPGVVYDVNEMLDDPEQAYQIDFLLEALQRDGAEQLAERVRGLAEARLAREEELRGDLERRLADLREDPFPLFASEDLAHGAAEAFDASPEALRRARAARVAAVALSKGLGSSTPGPTRNEGFPSPPKDFESAFGHQWPRPDDFDRWLRERYFSTGALVRQNSRTFDNKPQVEGKVVDVSGTGRFALSGTNDFGLGGKFPDFVFSGYKTTMERCRSIGHLPRPYADRDPNCGGTGGFYLAHADKRTLWENPIVGDSIPMCEDCTEFTKRLAAARNESQFVRDSDDRDRIVVPRRTRDGAGLGVVDVFTRSQGEGGPKFDAERDLVAPNGVTVSQDSGRDRFEIQFYDGFRLRIGPDENSPPGVRFEQSIHVPGQGRSWKVVPGKEITAREDRIVYSGAAGRKVTLTVSGRIIVEQGPVAGDKVGTELSISPGPGMVPSRPARLRHTGHSSMLTSAWVREDPLPKGTFSTRMGRWTVGESSGASNQCLYDTVLQLAAVQGINHPALASVQHLREAVAEEEAQWGFSEDHLAGVLTDAEATVDEDLQVIANLLQMRFEIYLGVGGDALFGAQLPTVGSTGPVVQILYTRRHFQPLWRLP